MKKEIVTIAAYLCTLQAFAQMPVENEVHHKIIFENDLVRLIDLTLATKDTTLLHTHSAASVVLFLSKSKLAIQNVGQSTAVTQVNPGDVVYRNYDEKPVAHKVWCDDNSLFRCLIVEIKPNVLGFNCAKLPIDVRQQWQQRRVNAYRVDFQDSKVYHLPKSSCPYMLISFSGIVTANYSGNKSMVREGEFVFIPPGNEAEVLGSRGAESILFQLR